VMRRCALAVPVVLAVVVVPAATSSTRPVGVVTTCAHQSSARFPHAFSSARNLVVGPLVLVGGGELTPAAVVRKFNGNKFPVLVAAGHRVTLHLTRRTRRFVSLGYARLPHNRELTVADGHRVVTFRACDRRHSYSDASGRRVTFWSGFVLASKPSCVRLRVWIDAERKPRHAKLPLGRRC
jgi:hypothetical protein